MDVINVEEYKTWIGGIARRFKQSQIKAATAVNVEMLKFYWSLGADIVRLEKDQPWGSRFMQRVSADLKTWMPEAKCFSPTNLKYMRRFFKLYCPAPIGQRVADQLEVKGAQQNADQIVQQVADRLPIQQFEGSFPNVARLIFSVPSGISVGLSRCSRCPIWCADATHTQNLAKSDPATTPAPWTVQWHLKALKSARGLRRNRISPRSFPRDTCDNLRPNRPWRSPRVKNQAIELANSSHWRGRCSHVDSVEKICVCEASAYK